MAWADALFDTLLQQVLTDGLQHERLDLFDAYRGVRALFNAALGVLASIAEVIPFLPRAVASHLAINPGHVLPAMKAGDHLAQQILGPRLVVPSASGQNTCDLLEDMERDNGLVSVLNDDDAFVGERAEPRQVLTCHRPVVHDVVSCDWMHSRVKQ
jgi:hypothetical protein